MIKRENVSTSTIISLLLTMLLVLLAVFTILMQSYTRSSYSLQLNNVNLIKNTQEFKRAITESQYSLERYLSTENIFKLSDHYAALRDANEALGEISQLLDNADAKFLLQSMKYAFRSYENACSDAYLMFTSHDGDYYITRQSADEISSFLTQYSDEMLTLISDGNIDALNQDIESSRFFLRLNLLFLVLFILTLIIIVRLFSSRIRRPIEKIAAQARALGEGNLLTARSEVGKSDRQVELLSRTFNDMADQIVKMMNDLKDKMDAEEQLFEEQQKNLEYEARLHKATILALQSQTNPHFLYNTLNSIDRTIQLGSYDEARVMIRSLSDLMRYNLSDGEVPAILSEEIDITLKYLTIQKMRFSERLTYSVDVDPELSDTLSLPRFTLQPLVENAIIHGISPKENGGKIEIRAYKEDDDYAIISISDDGVGFDSAKESGGTHVGLDNTRKRLELFSLSDDVLSIESAAGKGTVVKIRLRRDI